MKKNYLCDLHLHTMYSPDSNAGMKDMCDVAINTGLKYIAFTDHVEIPAFIADGYDKSIAQSFNEACKLKKIYKDRLHIARGVEMGEPMHDLKTAEALLETYEFDYVLGSLHNLLGEVDFFYYDYSDVDIKRLMERFFNETLDMVRWGRFDTLAHLTYPFRYLPNTQQQVNYDPWMEIIDEIFRVMAEKGIALEINTSGFRHGSKTMPDAELISRFKQLGGQRVTIGSDAHKVADVGKYVEDGIKAAKSAGFEYIAIFQNRKAKMLSIN